DCGDLGARTGDHQRQGPLRRPGDAAADRTIDLHDIFLLERLEDALGHDRAGGRKIDEAAHAPAFDHAASAGRDFEHDLGRRQARHHRFDRVGDLADRAGGLRAERCESLGRLTPRIEYEEAMTGLDEAAYHVETHLAEPNEADIHISPSLRAV